MPRVKVHFWCTVFCIYLWQKNGPNGPDSTGRPLAPNFPFNQSRMALLNTRIATHRNHEDLGCSGFSEKAFDRLCAETLGDQRRQRCLLHLWKVSLKSSPQISRKINYDHHFSFFLANLVKMVIPRFGMEQDQLRSIMQVYSLKSCFLP